MVPHLLRNQTVKNLSAHDTQISIFHRNSLAFQIPKAAKLLKLKEEVA